MALYSNTLLVTSPEGQAYEIGFSIDKWMNFEDDDWADVEFTTFNPDTDEDYVGPDWEQEQVVEYMKANFKKIDKAISEDNFYNPDDF